MKVIRKCWGAERLNREEHRIMGEIGVKRRANPAEDRMKSHVASYHLTAQFKNINERMVEYMLNGRRENTRAKGYSHGESGGD